LEVEQLCERLRLSGQLHQFLDLGEPLIHSFGLLASDVYQQTIHSYAVYACIESIGIDKGGVTTI